MLRRLFRTNPSPRHGAPARARIVQSLAGLAAGVRQTRRGSFLIMVVGTLALLAVITVIYVSVGRADSQTSAAATKFTERDDVPDAMRDYLAGIIAADLFDAVYLGERDEAGAPIFRREAWDYPSSPFQVVLPDTGGAGDTPLTFVTVGDGTDPRFWFNPTGGLTGTDPWLASSRPTLLNIDGMAASETDPTQYYQERLDWMHMSIVAPDGMPVNLWNLRERDKGWEATPWEMREGVTLFVSPPDQPSSRNYLTDYGDSVDEVPTASSRPYWWSSRQRWAFHPEVDPNKGPGDPEYMLYQYADADGDGFLDSRWFEMVLARDPANPQDAGWLIGPDRLRYFFAVRIEDLSGRVNVNTATDSTLPPAMTEPYGFTPAAVDLRRALTLQDTYADFNMQNIGYDALKQPKTGNPPPVDDYSAYDQPAAFTAGEKAYDAVRMVLDTGTMPPDAGLNGLALLAAGNPGAVDREFLDPATGGLNAYWANYWKLLNTSDPALSPNDYYELFGGFGASGGAGMLSAADPYSGVGRGFASDSLLELLRFRGVNDGSERSPLEAAIGGRGADADYSNDLARFSPLRDNRSADLEESRGEFVKNRFVFEDYAKAASSVDVRQILTTHSGARPIHSTKIPEDPANPGYPSAGALDIDESDVRENVVELLDEENVQKLFQLYADALLPYSADDTHWSSLPGALASDTLYYGYRGPELALRTAAHMAVNLMDAYDDSDKKKPTARRLIAVEGKTSMMPELRLPGNRLALSVGDVLSPAVTVFGIEAQPFVTGVASYVMYTDAPPPLGDVDGDSDDGDPTNATPITIEGDIASDNHDFLFQCIAFQLHNPFNDSLDLTADAGQHYVQYGDNVFKLVDSENGDAAITLGPRTQSGTDTNTVVAYYVDPDPDTIAQRWADVTGNDVQVERDRFDDWVLAQFGEGAIRVKGYTDSTFATEVSTYLSDLLKDSTDGGVVYLYRDDPDAQPSDVLVDRLRDPDRADALDRTLPAGSHDITGANEDVEGQGDNDGLTITRYASIRRSDDPRGDSTEDPPLGALPAYCIESKSQSYLSNVLDIDGSADDSLKISDFTKDPQGDRNPDGAITKQSDETDPNSRLAPSTELPEERGSDGFSKDTIRGSRDQRPFEGSAEYPPLYVEPHLNNRRFGYDTDGDGVSDVSTMRVADVLLPLGIGPHYSMEEGWTTLSEALSYALNYDDPGEPEGAAYKGVPLPPSIYADAIDPDPTGNPDDPDIRLLDTGFLRPDGFSPFFDSDLNGRFDPATDSPWGAGVPMVAALLDRITTVPATYGSLNSPTHGLVNINTAPREVVRLLPGLSPPPAADPFGDQLWWWGAGAPHDSESDIATTLVAFRDHLLLHPRDLVGGATEPVNFRDWFADPNDPLGARSLPPQGGLPPGYDPDENSRRGATGIPVVREGLGFHSLGEITYLRDWAFEAPPGTLQPYPHDIDRLGFDGAHVAQEGVDPMTYDTDGDGIPDASGDDEVEDDFDERLALASAVMNSASVRSDFFAVWFVMHGYSETDVSGLRRDDPLIPTVARRFVMVVDRSNVTEPGQKPRIVLFKEVPL